MSMPGDWEGPALELAAKVLVVLLYIVLMLVLGYWSMKRTKDVGDFFIGGRTLGPWISAIAYGTTYFSAVLFVGFAGKIGWGFGMYSLLVALGNALVGTLFAWWLLARRTREVTERLDAITMPEFMASRYGLAWMRPVAALVVFIFLVPYSASVYQGLGYLFEANLGIGYLPAIAFMAVLTGVYLVMGGYLAVARTDFVQGLMQFFGVVIMVLLFAKATGLGVVGNMMAGLEPGSAPGIFAPPKPGQLFPGWLTLASLVFMTSVGPMGLPQMVQKFYSIKSHDVVVRGMIIATVFSLFIACGAYYTGGLSHQFFSAPKPPAAAASATPGAPAPAAKPVAAPAADGKQELPMLPNGKGPDFDRIVPQMLTQYTPPWFSVIVLLIVLAASMSTLASLVLVSSAAVVVDLIGARDSERNGPQQGLVMMRVLCGVFVALSVVLASYKVDAIVTLMSMSWGALAGAFIGPFVWGLFWRRVTAAGAVAGFLGGLGLSVGLFFGLGPANAPMGASIAMLASLVLTPLVSLVTPKLPAGLVGKAFGAAVK